MPFKSVKYFHLFQYPFTVLREKGTSFIEIFLPNKAREDTTLIIERRTLF